jgi:hypothetical protein
VACAFPFPGLPFPPSSFLPTDGWSSAGPSPGEGHRARRAKRIFSTAQKNVLGYRTEAPYECRRALEGDWGGGGGLEEGSSAWGILGVSVRFEVVQV